MSFIVTPVVLQFAERGAAALFASLWHAALLIAVVSACLRLMPRMQAAARSVVWSGVWGAVLLLVLVSPWLQTGARVSAGSGVAAHGVRLDALWSVAIVAVWLVISVVRGVGLVLSARRVLAVWREAVPVDGAAVLEVTGAFGVSRSAQLCVSAMVERPSVIGFWKPRVLIPAALYAKLTAAELGQVLLHEMEHLRRGDDWRNLLQKLALVVFPLNPFLLWVERRLCFERELACDESVLRATNAPKSYAACLVHLAEERTLGRQMLLALGAWERRSELAKRVLGILTSDRQTVRSRRYGQVAASSLCAVVLVAAVALGRSPLLVSFADAPAFAGAAAVRSFSSGMASPMQDAVFSPGAVAANGALQTHAVEAVMRVPVKSVKPVRVRAVRQARRVSCVRKASRQTAPARAAVSAPRFMAARWSEARQDGGQPVQTFSRMTFAVYRSADGFQIISTEVTPLTTETVIIFQL